MCNAHNHSADCTCGFGGEVHHGSVSGIGSVARTDSCNYIYSKRFEDVCYSTKCPINGCEPVWFIRHNGGSVWVDALGWPWPKHGCFEGSLSDETYACISILAKNHDGLTSQLGLINRIWDIDPAQGSKLQIGSLDGSLITVYATPGSNYYQLLGELVTFSIEAGLLRHSKWGDFRIFLKPKREWVQCKCKCWVEKKYLADHLQAYRCGESKSLITNTSDRTKIKKFSQIKIKNGKKKTRILLAIELVIKEAWHVARINADADVNFRLVKQEAIRIIWGLSPHVRRDVEYYFTSQKWLPLMKRALGP